ncbi:uncharacterized protein [Watersipora subatra]|uniref:uncharacterized protein n=1 Tax=Watersipora subatra TaxID=2589382 RepID=UPI00355B09F9
MQQQQMQQPLQQLWQQQHVMQPAQPQFATQSGVTVVNHHTEKNICKLKSTALSQLKGLSIAQLVVGGLCLLFGIILLPAETDKPTAWLSSICYGIWCGAYFIFVGGIGFGAVMRNTSSWINATMILNILTSTIFFPVLLILSSIAVSLNTSSSQWDRQAYTAFNSILLLLSIAELVITIWSSVICCGAVCFCCFPVYPNHQAHYGAPAFQAQQHYVNYQRTVQANQVNLSGYQATTGDQVPTAPTLPSPELVIGYEAQSQQPPSYYDVVHTTPNQNLEHDHSPVSAHVTQME